MTKEDLKRQLARWFEDRVPKDWKESLEVEADSQEILILVKVAEPAYPKGAGAEAKEQARAGAIGRFREETRAERIEIASEAERLFNRKVSWGVRTGETTKMFTGLGMPVMTRLRLRERAVLDTLVASGVARSRSEALAWCVGLVASKQAEWLESLRDASKRVEEVRKKGPNLITA